jgi:hypothetical protein
VVTNACAFYNAHAAADAPSVRHSLRPLFSRGQKFRHSSGAPRREIVGAHPNSQFP